MAAESVADLIAALTDRTSQIRRLLESVASTQDARLINEHWSFREVAAHMEACQTECVLVRIRQIAAGAKPHVEFYDNDGWDFSDRDLRDSLDTSEQRRARVLASVRSRPPERRARTGRHPTSGAL